MTILISVMSKKGKGTSWILGGDAAEKSACAIGTAAKILVRENKVSTLPDIVHIFAKQVLEEAKGSAD